MTTEVEELVGFLGAETRADVRGTALEVVLSLTASRVSLLSLYLYLLSFCRVRTIYDALRIL
jgi:hypothetical protein